MLALSCLFLSDYSAKEGSVMSKPTTRYLLGTAALFVATSTGVAAQAQAAAPVQQTAAVSAAQKAQPATQHGVVFLAMTDTWPA